MQRLQNKHAFGLIAVSLGYADTLMSLSGETADIVFVRGMLPIYISSLNFN